MAQHDEAAGLARLDALLDEALERSPEARAAFIDRLREEQPELAQSLQELLTAFDQVVAGDSDVLDDAHANGLADMAAAAIADVEQDDESLDDTRLGSHAGAYRLTAVIGRGGRATVYRGERHDETWSQTAAVKIMRRGIDTHDAIRRFHTERRILAGLQHPGIAPLLDGGITSDGLPFFAMPEIKGQPITAFCADQRLDLRAPEAVSAGG